MHFEATASRSDKCSLCVRASMLIWLINVDLCDTWMALISTFFARPHSLSVYKAFSVQCAKFALINSRHLNVYSHCHVDCFLSCSNCQCMTNLVLQAIFVLATFYIAGFHSALTLPDRDCQSQTCQCKNSFRILSKQPPNTYMKYWAIFVLKKVFVKHF